MQIDDSPERRAPRHRNSIGKSPAGDAGSNPVGVTGESLERKNMFNEEEIKAAVVASMVEKISGGNNSNNEKVFVIGEKVLIRTATMYSLGRVTKEAAGFVWLDDACWIRDTGDYGVALKTGELEGFEISLKAKRVAIGSIIDIDSWDHDLKI